MAMSRNTWSVTSASTAVMSVSSRYSHVPAVSSFSNTTVSTRPVPGTSSNCQKLPDRLKPSSSSPSSTGSPLSSDRRSLRGMNLHATSERVVRARGPVSATRSVTSVGVCAENTRSTRSHASRLATGACAARGGCGRRLRKVAAVAKATHLAPGDGTRGAKVVAHFQQRRGRLARGRAPRRRRAPLLLQPSRCSRRGRLSAAQCAPARKLDVRCGGPRRNHGSDGFGTGVRFWSL